MESVEVERQRCAVHPERHAVERCPSCGRLACLACAVPFRGEVRCADCAAREAGTTPPPATPWVRAGPADALAGVLLTVALVATVPPWDRFGVLTAALSAWRPGWSLVAALCVLAGAGMAWLVVARRGGRTRLPISAYTTLAWGAVATITFVVLRSPAFISHTAAPYVALAAAAAGGLVGAIRLPRSGERQDHRADGARSAP